MMVLVDPAQKATLTTFACIFSPAISFDSWCVGFIKGCEEDLY